jgi:hypothetical protein
MKMIYTHENRFFVANAKNILEANDSEYDRACDVINNALSKEGDAEWVCSACHEKNDASFELCWNCQSDAIATTPGTV